MISFLDIVRAAWADYDSSRQIASVVDISAQVSTNHVYRIRLTDRTTIVGKLSYFGKYEHFVEDHSIINALANNLPAPFEDFLARSLVKGRELYVYRHQEATLDAWVVFYRPVKVRERMPKRLDEDQIEQFATEFAHFHQACYRVRNTLPAAFKTAAADVEHLLELLETPERRFEFRGYESLIREHCALFTANTQNFVLDDLERIPVFVDWNIGNFSITPTGRFYSRWDYDWFRMSTRVLDFYFASRVVSDRGDRSTFIYDVDVLTEPRFVQFLKRYHEIYPLTEAELMLLGEAYRFFLLNYVIKDGRYFFHELFATKLLAEALEFGLPSVDNFDPRPLIDAVLT